MKSKILFIILLFGVEAVLSYPGSRTEHVFVKCKNARDTMKKLIAQRKYEKAVHGPDKPKNKTNISKLDLRIGQIVATKVHPADGTLYVSKIDIGNGTIKVTVTGFASPVDPDDLFGLMTVVLVNYNPVKHLDVVSEVIMLCARRDAQTEPLLAPPGAVPGDLVYIDGYGRHPIAVIHSGKKLFQKVAEEFITNMEREACYKTHVWRVLNKGPIKAPTLVNAYIK